MLTEITIQPAVENDGANHHLYGSLRAYQPVVERLQPRCNRSTTEPNTAVLASGVE